LKRISLLKTVKSKGSTPEALAPLNPGELMRISGGAVGDPQAVFPCRVNAVEENLIMQDSEIRRRSNSSIGAAKETAGTTIHIADAGDFMRTCDDSVFHRKGSKNSTIEKRYQLDQ
jgi:hypothetical protein